MKKIIEKKHRLSHNEYKGFVRVAFVCCLKNKDLLFCNPTIKETTLECIKEAATHTGIEVTLYVIMPDHLHLIVKGNSEKADAYKFAKGLKYNLTKRLKKNILQKDFFDHIIRNHFDLAKQIIYIIENPVRKKLVNNWREYDGIGSLTGSVENVIDFAVGILNDNKNLM